MSAPAAAAAAMSRRPCASSVTKMGTHKRVIGFPPDTPILFHFNGNFLEALFDLLFRAFAGFPERQAKLARVQARGFHGVLDPHRISVEEHRTHQRKQLAV